MTFRSPIFDSPAKWLAKDSNLYNLRPAFVFAHPDDAVLSALSALEEMGSHALDIVVCAGRPHTREPGVWDRQCRFFSSYDAWASRLAEHNAVSSLIGVPSVFLDIVDSQYGPTGGDLWERVQHTVTTHLKSAGSNIAVTHCRKPHHPDHQHVVTLMQRVAVSLGIPILFTCDRPYFCCSKTRCESAVIQPQIEPINSFFLHEETWALKQDVVGKYVSQHVAMGLAFGPSWFDDTHLRYECYALGLSAMDEGKESCY